MGFRVRLVCRATDALVLWEAQLATPLNGAQTIVDEFVSLEQKWGQRSSVVLLLLHGYLIQGWTTCRHVPNVSPVVR